MPDTSFPILTKPRSTPGRRVRSPSSTGSCWVFTIARAEELGARVLMDRSDDPDEPLYVMGDPEGHPFCLLVG